MTMENEWRTVSKPKERRVTLSRNENNINMNRKAFCHALLLPFLIVIHSLAQEADPVANARETLARDAVKTIVDKAGNPTFITFNMENRSSLPAADTLLLRKSIEKQFRAVKVSLVKPDRAQAEIKITITENITGLLWVAEIKLGSETNVMMQEFPHIAVTAAPPIQTILELKDDLLATDIGQILDFSAIDGKQILVLKPDSIYIIGQDSKSNPRTFARIPHDQPWPRDLRGRLMVHGKEVEAHFPGYLCKGTLQDLSTFHCSDSEDPWPLTAKGEPTMSGFYSPVRNFFTGAIAVEDVTAEQNLPPFFSAARVGDGANTLWLFAGTNGRTRLYGKFNQPIKTFNGWGSSLATLPNECKGNWLVLTTRPGDGTQNDQLIAMEIVNRDASIASNPVEVNGTVDALWIAPDNSAVHAVIKNHETGAYEAHRITVRCSH